MDLIWRDLAGSVQIRTRPYRFRLTGRAAVWFFTPMLFPARFAPRLDQDPITEAKRLARALLEHVGITPAVVTLEIVRSGGAGCSGFVSFHGAAPRMFARTLTIQIGSCDWASVVETLAHEIAHLVYPPTREEGGHSPRFWRGLCDLVRETFDVDVQSDLPSCDLRLQENLIVRHPGWAPNVFSGFVGNARESLLQRARDVVVSESALVVREDVLPLVYQSVGAVQIPLRDCNGDVISEWHLTLPRVLETIRLEVGETMLRGYFADLFLKSSKSLMNPEDRHGAGRPQNVPTGADLSSISDALSAAA